MQLNRYLTAYFVFSVLGWIWECIYCTIKERKWQNRGFLYGPVCPIYGLGSIMALFSYDLILLGVVPNLSWWMILIVGFFFSMILEYPTSYILEKKFHARWWDYSNLPLIINGRTCAITSIGFGIGAIIIMNYLIPSYEKILVIIPATIIAVLCVIFVALHSSDFTLTVSNLTNFQRNIDELEKEFQDKMTEEVDKIFEKHSKIYGSTLSRIASFKMNESHNLIATKIIKKLRDARRRK